MEGAACARGGRRTNFFRFDFIPNFRQNGAGALVYAGAAYETRRMAYQLFYPFCGRTNGNRLNDVFLMRRCGS